MRLKNLIEDSRRSIVDPWHDRYKVVLKVPMGEDFTSNNYDELLELAKKHGKFSTFGVSEEHSQKRVFIVFESIASGDDFCKELFSE